MLFMPDNICATAEFLDHGTFAKGRWFATAIHDLISTKTGQKHTWDGLDLKGIKN